MAKTKTEKVTVEEARAAVEAQPIVGVTAMAAILGIAVPNVSRLRKQGRLPEPVAVEGSGAFYFRSEVEALRDAMQAPKAAAPESD